MNNTQTNQNNNQNTSNNNANNSKPNNNYNQPYQQYQAAPKRKSTATVVVAIILVLMGASYIVNEFLPWVFDWLDSGLIVAGVAIIAGFGLLIKK